MPFTIASLLNTPPDYPVAVRKKRSASAMSPDPTSESNKRRILYAFPDSITVKSENETPKYESPYSERLAYTYPGWCYWLPTPGESLPPYEPVPVDDNMPTFSSPNGIGLGLGLGIAVPLEAIDVEETHLANRQPASGYTSRPYLNNNFSPKPLDVDSSPHYTPPSPLDLLTQSLIQSFVAWKRVICPSTPAADDSVAYAGFNEKGASPNLQNSSSSVPYDWSPRYVPPSPADMITQYLLESFASWRPSERFSHQ